MSYLSGSNDLNRRTLLQFLGLGGAVILAPRLCAAGELPANSVTFTVTGLERGDVVAVFMAKDDGSPDEVLAVQRADDVDVAVGIPKEYVGREAHVRVRNGGKAPIKSFETHTPIRSEGAGVIAIRVPDL